MALSLFAKALVGIFALQAKQAIGEPNKPAAAVAYDAEGFTPSPRTVGWFNQHVLHVAATDILSYLEILRAFLEYQHSRLNSATTTA